MQKYLSLIYFIIISLSVAAQEAENKDLTKITTSSYKEDSVSQNKWGLKAGGYISADLFWDTRQMVESRDGVLCLYPENVLKDINGKDINARPSFNFLVLNSRVSLRITAPDALGAKVSGLVEGWFAGMSNNDMNGFAMRHAFIKMDWYKKRHSSLLMGQTWHPLFTEDYFPKTIAGSAGAPFQPFSRSAQIRFTQHLGKSKIMLYLSSQRDFLSSGPAGASSSYLRNSAIPELGIQYLNQRCGRLDFGLGYDYKYLIPRITTDNNLYTRNGVHSQAAMAFVNYYFLTKSGKRTNIITAKAMYTRGCNEFLMLGGYAYQYFDNQPLNTEINYTYTPINTISAWIDLPMPILFRKSFGGRLFGGYTQNLGSNKIIQDWDNSNAYFSRGRNIKHIYRISARVMYYATDKLQFGIEPEYTVAAYGNTVNEYGIVQKPSDLFPDAKINIVGNLRILFNTTLYF